MGIGPSRTCSTNYRPAPQPVNVYVTNEIKPTQPIAPNPVPTRWRMLEKQQFNNAFVLKVRYLDCTNFEGIKVMVYEGTYNRERMMYLDPHFHPSPYAPIARFRPDAKGWEMACNLAQSM